MKKALFNKIICLASVLIILFAITIGGISLKTARAKTPFDRTNMPGKVQVTAAVALNVRSGPGTQFRIVEVVYNGQIIDCIGKLGTWYIVHLDNDVVGLASGTYLKPYYPPSPNPSTPAPTTERPDMQVSQEEQKMLELINVERANAGVSPLKMDAEIARVARIKAQEMVSKDYFSHDSPTYGSPFEMLKNFGISYRSAGENIAGNSTVERAHTSLMNSEGHRKNILNNSYNYIGIGIVDSKKYGKIFVQMYVGK